MSHLDHPCIVVQISPRRWIVAKPTFVTNKFETCTFPIDDLNVAYNIANYLNNDLGEDSRKPEEYYVELVKKYMLKEK